MPTLSLNDTTHTISTDQARAICHELIDQLATLDARAPGADARDHGSPIPDTVRPDPAPDGPDEAAPKPRPTPPRPAAPAGDQESVPVYTSTTRSGGHLLTDDFDNVESSHSHDGCTFRALPAALEVAAHNRLDLGDLATIAETPDETWRSPTGNGAQICVRSRWGVVIAGNDPHLILAVRPTSDLVQQRNGSQPARLSSTKVHRETAIGSVTTMIERLQLHGFTVELKKGGHYKITHPSSTKTVPMPASPSDHRWALNLRSQLRSVFGIDIRKQPVER